MVIRQKLLALPSKMSPRLTYMDDQKAIEADLEKEVRDALEELSKPQAYEDEVETEIQAGDNASAETPEAAA